MGKMYVKKLEELDQRNRPIVGQGDLLLKKINDFDMVQENTLADFSGPSKGDAHVPLICPQWNLFRHVDKARIRKDQKRKLVQKDKDPKDNWTIKRNTMDSNHKPMNANGLEIQHHNDVLLSDDSSDYSFTEQRLNNMYKEAGSIKAEVLSRKDSRNNIFLFKKNIEHCVQLDEITENIMKINRMKLEKPGN